MFCDQASVVVKAGNGGDGAVSFRREKYVEKGGPDGGDGGDGGNIIIRSTHACHTLSNYRVEQIWSAKDGERGSKKRMHGKNGDDLILEVPVGTLVTDAETQECVIDMNQEYMEYCLEYGGRGGYGNAHFTSSTRQVPRFAERGEIMFEKRYNLELKLVADIGIIGFPSVGKSTLISVISNARPKIAEYHFTTLVPNLGVVQVDDTDFVVADIPGLIEHASKGKGLGHDFLKHIERCGMLIHMLDVSDPDCIEKYSIINKELQIYSEILAAKNQIVVCNKMDVIDSEYKELLKEAFYKQFPHVELYWISAASHQGVQDLLYIMKAKINDFRQIQHEQYSDTPTEERVLFQPHIEDAQHWEIQHIDGKYYVFGKRIEQIANMTNTENIEALARLYDILDKKKITPSLKRIGWDESKTLSIGRWKIDFHNLQ